MRLLSLNKGDSHFKVTVTWTVLNPADKARHAKLVSLVERMLELHKRSPRLPQEIESTDGRIDRLVYELYGLTEDEIRIVES